MGKGKGPWNDGRRAWERLNGWHQDGPDAAPGHPDTGPAAVEALADIGLVRHLLDQAELVAVRTARRHGKSWAEIAIKLGITRQSAWERWRYLDNDEAARTGAVGSDPASSDPVDLGQADLGQERVVAESVKDVVRLRAGEVRRRSTVVVPNVVGLSWHEALRVLAENGLAGVGSDLDGRPPTASTWPGAVVTDQSPESRARVIVGSPVTLWREHGGGSAGVREPRHPHPSPSSVREMHPEPSDEAVS